MVMENKLETLFYIKDVVNANIAACKSDFNGVVNVASGEKLTILSGEEGQHSEPIFA